jgi:amidase
MPGYTTFVNMLDYSAVVFPVTTVDKSIDVVDVNYTPLNETDEKVWKSCKFLLSSVKYVNDLADGFQDDPELYDGAHVAVQIVGRRLQEEKVLALTEILGDALSKNII